VSCLWSNCTEFMALVMVLICGLVQVLLLSLVVNFSIAIFLVLPLDWICSQVLTLTVIVSLAPSN
jgi:hypothetical protein